MKHNNNFDFLRLLFSFLVVIGHAIILSGKAEFRNEFFAAMPNYSVFSFFVISGFLVYSSFERIKTTKKYLLNRIKRILPAYLFVVIFFAFFLVIFSNNHIPQYFSMEWIKYLGANLTFLNFLKPCIPGIFETNKMCAVNGSLWTIKVEIMFYFFVPILYYLLRNKTLKNKNFILLSLYILSLIYFNYVENHYGRLIAKQLPGCLTYFVSGIFLHLNLDFFKRRWQYFIIPAIFIIFFEKIIFSVTFIFPFALAIVIIGFAFSKIPLRNFAKYGDFSYGLYLVHFPIIQIFVQQNIYNKYSFTGLYISFIVIFFSSILIWKFVESPFLKRKKNHSKT